MKTEKFKQICFCVLMMTAAVVLQSCNDDDDGYSYSRLVPNAVVTLKTNPANGAFYMQLDDSTTLVPSNIKSSPYGGKQVRALANFRYENPQKGHSAQAVYVNWIDTIRTKDMAADLGTKNDSAYGTDPLEVVNDWTTVVEDGYLTLRFRTRFSGFLPHVLNLVKGEKPGEVVLYHNAKGDGKYGQVADGLIAFSLDSLKLDFSHAGTLTLKWKSYAGDKTVSLPYHPRNH